MSNRLNGAHLPAIDWKALPPLLDTKEAAKALNVSVSFLVKSRCEGVVGGRTMGPQAVKTGRRRVMYRVSDLQAWVESLKGYQNI